MKILTVSQYYYPEVFRITDICSGLVERGHEVDVLTSLPNVPQGKFYDGYGWFHRGEKYYKGVHIDRVGVVERSKSNKLLWTLNCASFAINSLFHLPAYLKKEYDAVFVFNNSPVTVILPALVFSKIKKIPNLIYILDIWPESLYSLVGADHINKNSLFYRISSAVCKWLYKSGDTLLISSKGFEEKLRDMGLSSRFSYFPNYAEEIKEDDSFSVSREDLGFDDDDFVVGFAGGMGPAQGIDLVLEAAERLKHDKNLKLLLMGDGTEYNKLKEIVKEKNLTDKVLLPGWIALERLPAYMRICDCMMMCLKDNEVLNITVPAKLQTYMSYAKPVIAFMNGAGAGVVQDACCGVSVQAEDVAGLTKAFSRLRSMEKSELEKIGANGKRYCDEVFERSKILDLLEKELSLATGDKS